MIRIILLLGLLTSCAGVNKCRNFQLTVTENKKQIVKDPIVIDFEACQI